MDSRPIYVRVNREGRLVIPAKLRKELRIEPGERLLARAEAGRLVLERREAIVARLQALFTHIPTEVSLADELIAERRTEAARENRD